MHFTVVCITANFSPARLVHAAIFHFISGIKLSLLITHLFRETLVLSLQFRICLGAYRIVTEVDCLPLIRNHHVMIMAHCNLQ
ncbi:hypothetical protein WJ62_11970 [Burkholderia diffusa]|nr:hypothetical protein WJ62_11970 [Burkholderia diffusa]